ncbi:3'-5' exonuclease [Lactobacillus sp. PV037]|uniref:exonuclease domain-containing protein n=1 Tax=unclassified Lactobacillus TaxID=2620435 RepID=UPI00223F4294|nr:MULTISPECIES: exonuclease domain-containing protein [unclassified Lactobacillus]QNQ82727.1 3'-5' exonuclease [Lactobacillus sp. PV012]QNQ83154.1 3'-5' exonuclease [Lactobacillus sp. PV037]
MSISIMQGVLNIPGAQHKIRAKGMEKPGFPENYTLIDVETTGLNPTYSRITEMGGLKVRRGKVIQTFSELVKFPDSNKVPAYISKLNGIDEAKIEAEGMPVDEAIKKFRYFIGSDPIVGYNVNFDLNFVYDLIAKYDLPVLSNDYVDVYRLARSFYPDQRHNRLIDCLNRLGIAQTQDHRGLQDTIDTKAVFDELHRQFKQDHLLRAHEMIKSVDLTNEWPDFVKQTYNFRSPFKNKNITITGDWDLNTTEVAQALRNLGGQLQEKINEDSDYLLIGDNDRFRTDLTELNKAKLLKDQGSKIHLWTEKYFLNALDNWARS